MLLGTVRRKNERREEKQTHQHQIKPTKWAFPCDLFTVSFVLDSGKKKVQSLKVTQNFSKF